MHINQSKHFEIQVYICIDSLALNVIMNWPLTKIERSVT